MSKMLAFFGAFNPPTKAHVQLAKLAMRKTGAKSVTFIPSKSSYILGKQKKAFCFCEGERLGMLDAICKDDAALSYTSHDITSPTQPRSYETLKWLRDTYHCEPTLLVGADQFQAMEEHWKFVPEIAREFGIAVLTRSALSVNAILNSSPFYKEIAPNVCAIETPQNTRNISSTSVRYDLQKLMEHQEALREAVPDAVYDYIKENYIDEV